MSEQENDSVKKEDLANIKGDDAKEQEEITAELEKLPPEVRRIMEISMERRVSAPLLSPLQEKINEQHIDKILEIVEKDNERTFSDTQEARKYTLVYIIIFLSFFTLLTVFLVNKDVAVYQELLKIIIIFGGGFGSGIGFKGYLDRKK